MKREFEINEIVHLGKGKRVRGILNFGTKDEAYTDFNLRFKDEVKILGYEKIADKYGGYIYDCEALFKGDVYRIEGIVQIDLIPKEMWKTNVLQENKIFALENNYELITVKAEELENFVEKDVKLKWCLEEIVHEKIIDKLDGNKFVDIRKFESIGDTFYIVYRIATLEDEDIEL